MHASHGVNTTTPNPITYFHRSLPPLPSLKRRPPSPVKKLQCATSLRTETMFRRCSTLHYCLSSMPHHCFSSTPHRCISISPEAGEVSSLPPPLLPTATPCLCSQPPRVPIFTPLPPRRLRSTAAAPSSLYCCRAVVTPLFPRPSSLRHTRVAIAPSHSRRRRSLTLASRLRRHTRVSVALGSSADLANQETVQKVCDIVKKQLALPEGSIVTGESKFAALGAVLQLNMANVLLEKGIDLNAEDEEGFCADVAEVLVKKGADVEARSMKVNSVGAKDEEHENKGKDESCEAAESRASEREDATDEVCHVQMRLLVSVTVVLKLALEKYMKSLMN
ncbi:hypothetical protein Ahy_A10g046988 isoform K [Arachis hypogaea]|uniref:Uncharacterized protein n=1 Tax=Arachis hypogaea TaxID=3818 RepID=A0A445B177_ARAHY|nr:hypothetical protein Ahy_A10g046988 isoform K [Arachis hypogaea]